MPKRLGGMRPAPAYPWLLAQRPHRIFHRPFTVKRRWGRLRGVNRRTFDKIGTVFVLLGFAFAGSARAEESTPAAPPGDVGDYIVDARLLSRLVACAGDAELPTTWPS